MSDAPYLACSLVGWNTTWFRVAEELVNLTAIIDHRNMLKPYMEVLILYVLHLPPEKRPAENGVIAGKLQSH